MVRWWERDITGAGKLPLMLCFLAFVLTFLITRLITRMIRGHRGPFRDQVTSSGVHIHHAVPGLVLLMAGAFTAVGGPGTVAWRSAAGVMVGIGVSLVLDEFALIVHLQDVYWSGEGQLSVEVVSLTASCLGLALVGFSPWGVSDVDGVELTFRLSATAFLVVNEVMVLTCVLKGKYRVALYGQFLPPLAFLGGIRLARPTSVWARRRYGPERLARATRRAADFDRHWNPIQTRWEDLIGGTPSRPDPAPVTPDQPTPGQPTPGQLTPAQPTGSAESAVSSSAEASAAE